MHIIKFRGKSLSTGEWVYGWHIREARGLINGLPALNLSQAEIVSYIVFSADGELQIHEVDPKTVGQYIGVNDHNAKEIFEGDIVKWDDGSAGRYWRVAQVVYMPGFWRFEIIPGKSINCFKDGRAGAFDGGSFMYLPNTSAYNNVMEIIGNIHSNPDLLTQ